MAALVRPVGFRASGLEALRGLPMKEREKLKERFWAKVDRETAPNGCWTWQGTRDLNGYGVFCFEGTRRLAHRLSWELTFGPLPTERNDPIFVCHMCDNPPCVRPHHMFLGVSAANSADKYEKGRDLIVRRGSGTRRTRETTHRPATDRAGARFRREHPEGYRRYTGIDVLFEIEDALEIASGQDEAERTRIINAALRAHLPRIGSRHSGVSRCADAPAVCGPGDCADLP